MPAKFHVDGTRPLNGEIFVFGSNLAGIHGAGAAATANALYGAKFGRGIGLVGQSYAIPTKDRHIEILPLSEIKKYVDDFATFTVSNPALNFFVTGVGCGLAGYNPKTIAPLFKNANKANCSFPSNWEMYLPC